MSYLKLFTPMTLIGAVIVVFALSFDSFYTNAVPGFGLRQLFGVGVGLFIILIDLRRALLSAHWKWDGLLLAPYLSLILVAVLRPGDSGFAHDTVFLGVEFFSTRDAMINVVGFIPPGLLLAPLVAQLIGVRGRLALIAIVATIGFGFSLGIESLQHWWIPGRFSSASDLLANTLGFLLGAACQVYCGRRDRGKAGGKQRRIFAALR